MTLVDSMLFTEVMCFTHAFYSSATAHRIYYEHFTKSFGHGPGRWLPFLHWHPVVIGRLVLLGAGDLLLAEASFTQIVTYSEGGVRVVSASATSSGGIVSSPSEYCRTRG